MRCVYCNNPEWRWCSQRCFDGNGHVAMCRTAHNAVRLTRYEVPAASATLPEAGPTAHAPAEGGWCAHTLGARYKHVCTHCVGSHACDYCMPCAREECQWERVQTPQHLLSTNGPTIVDHCDNGHQGRTEPPLELLCRVCNSAAPQRCGRCHVAHYCGRAHQAEDWATHREDCMPNP